MNKPIRIAQVIGKWLGGGVESVVMNYYRNIDRTKIQFDFICDNDSTNIPYEEIQELGGRVILVPPYEKVLDYQKGLIKVFKANNYKIVHSHINTLSIFPLMAAKRAGVKVRISHSHSTSNPKETKRNFIKNILRKFSRIYATDYFCCSEVAGRYQFGNNSYDNGEVVLLNNAIDLDKFKYDVEIRNDMRKVLRISSDTIVIGHIGRFVTVKNHEFLIDIFNEIHKKNNNTLLVLAGQGPLMDEIKEKVKRLGLDDSVKFLGQRRDAYRLYQAFDMFLFPSLYEGLGMVAVEAQCAGLPCICSTEVPVITKVTDNVEFLDLNDDISKWRDTIIKLLNNYERKDNSNKISKRGYNIKEEVKKLENKYFSLIGR